jgi:putative transposase
VTTHSVHQEPVAPNLVTRQFNLEDHPHADQTSAAVITYIPTGEGWLYLAVLLDLASHRVVESTLSTRLTHSASVAPCITPTVACSTRPTPISSF